MDNSIGSDNTIQPGDDTSQKQTLSPGATLGQYKVIRLLGRGGMGQVYLARHEMQQTIHALKILPSQFAARSGFVERFRTELRTMARLQHPHIVHVTHSDEENGLYYLVMDFVAADSSEEPYDLEAALAEEKLLSADLVRRLMLQVCDGLSFAHENGVVHRDLKPANILLTSKDLEKVQAKVADFGLARVLGEDQVRTMVAQSVQMSMSMGHQSTFVEKKRTERSSTGAVLGTYGYMSPEQEEGKPADERSDIYALGVMIYRMLTGRRMRGMPKSASQLVDGLDPAWDEIISRCLEPDPDGRPASVAELIGGLEKLRGGSSSPVPRKREVTETPPASSPKTAPRQQDRVVPNIFIPSFDSDPTASNVLGTEFVEVTPGSFEMGSTGGWDDEQPVHAVTIINPFWIGKYPVTQGEYEELTGSNPSFFKRGKMMGILAGRTPPRRPVECVTWKDAVRFCGLLTERERRKDRLPDGYEYRLPTEAEWEYVARGGQKSQGYMYAGSDNVADVAWYKDNSGRKTHEVGQKRANELGIHDMSGNVWEWCYDWYDSDYYGKSHATDPVNTDAASYRVRRGGSWFISSGGVRSASRYWGRLDYTHFILGFRVCLAPQIRK